MSDDFRGAVTSIVCKPISLTQCMPFYVTCTLQYAIVLLKQCLIIRVDLPSLVWCSLYICETYINQFYHHGWSTTCVHSSSSRDQGRVSINAIWSAAAAAAAAAARLSTWIWRSYLLHTCRRWKAASPATGCRSRSLRDCGRSWTSSILRVPLHLLLLRHLVLCMAMWTCCFYLGG